MPKTVFVTNSVVLPAFLNAINNPVFVETPDNDGELPLITDDDMSFDPSNIKWQWRTYRDGLNVAASTGLSVTIAPGSALLPNGTVQIYPPQVLVVPDNVTTFIFLNKQGVISSALVAPVMSLLLASVTTSLGAIVSIIDLRTRFSVTPNQEAVKVIGGSGDEGDLVITSNTTLGAGEYYYSSLTIVAGVTVTIPSFARIFVSGDVNIAGTIVVTPALLGGATFPTSAPGTLGGAPGGGAGGLGGTYNYAVQNLGSGGAAGFIFNVTSNFDQGFIASGGKGGGGLIIESGGLIIITGSISANGDPGSVGVVTGGSPRISGGGGGSGGLLLFKSVRAINATATSVLQANGGAGGNALSGDAAGGGGGGGGIIAFLAPVLDVGSAAFQVNPGSQGVGLGNPTNALGGGRGGGFGGFGAEGDPNNSATAGQVIQRTIAPVA